jgi:hypothetical protein
MILKIIDLSQLNDFLTCFILNDNFIAPGVKVNLRLTYDFPCHALNNTFIHLCILLVDCESACLTVEKNTEGLGF